MIRKILVLLAALFLCAASVAAPASGKRVPASELRAERLFAARDWKGMDALLSSGKKLAPRALSLAANALWHQRRWEESLTLMRRVGARYPKEVAPFARLLSALALERIGEKRDARDAALAIQNDASAPNLARYYAMYLLARLADDADEKEEWLRRMMSAASDDGRRLSVCRELAEIGRLTEKDAFELLRAEPKNAAALKVVEEAPDSPQKYYRLGYAAYLRGNYASAVALLSRLEPDEPYGESGTYFLSLALRRLNRGLDAVPLLERLALKKDARYLASSMRELSRLFEGKAGPLALSALKKMTESEDARVASQALYTLATSRWKRASEARDEYLARFPSGPRAAALRWPLGWQKYLAGRYDEALKIWSDSATARLLYWRSKAHDALGQSDQAEKLRAELLSKHAFTVYAFLAAPEGSLRVDDSPLPENSAAAPPGELERWGFMTHAYMLLENASAMPDIMRRARIGKWLKLDWQIRGEVTRAAKTLMRGPSVSRELLEYDYPRPFRSTVESAAKKYGVPPLFIWSIMRQESGFNPNVTSRSGAAGLMQLMPATAADEARRMKLKNYSLYGVYDNINIGARYIAALTAVLKKNEWVAAAYNAGGGNVRKWNAARGGWAMDAWMESVPFPETNAYVKNVMANYAVYRKLYGKTAEQTDGAAP